MLSNHGSRWILWLLGWLMLTSSSLAQGKVKPPSSTPPIQYQISTSVPTPPAFDAYNTFLNDFNRTGGAVGAYNVDNNGVLVKRAWVYWPPFSALAFDPNDLDIPGFDAANWTIHSAIGINNNGLVVGRISSNGTFATSRGYVLNLSADPIQMWELPDASWPECYARKINDNGDILGVTQTNGVRTPYLFNVANIGAPSAELNVLHALASNYLPSSLSNPPPGVAATNCGSLDIAPYQYTAGSPPYVYMQITNTPDTSLSETGIFACTSRLIVNGRIQREKRLFRDVGTLESFSVSSSDYLRGINNSGTVLLANSGTGVKLYTSGTGFLSLSQVDASNVPLITSHEIRINDVGTGGFGQIAAVQNGVLLILTPVPTGP